MPDVIWQIYHVTSCDILIIFERLCSSDDYFYVLNTIVFRGKHETVGDVHVYIKSPHAARKNTHSAGSRAVPAVHPQI